MGSSSLSNARLMTPQQYDWERIQAKPPVISEGAGVPDVPLPFDGSSFISSKSYLDGSHVVVFTLPETFSKKSAAIFPSFAALAESIKKLGIEKFACIVPGKLDVIYSYLEKLDPTHRIPHIVPDYLAELSWSMGLVKYSTFGTHLEARPAVFYLEDHVVKLIAVDDEALDGQRFYKQLSRLLQTISPTTPHALSSSDNTMATTMLSPKDYYLERLQGMRPPVQPGERIPHVQIKLDDGTTLSTKDYFIGKVVAFTIPGAFTPVCTKRHFPGYVENKDAFEQLGINHIVCISPDKASDMQAWAEELDTEDKISLFPDQHSELILDKLGLGMNGIHPRGLGSIAQRAALFIEGDEEGLIVKLVVIEETGMKCGVSSAEVFYFTLASHLQMGLNIS